MQVPSFCLSFHADYECRHSGACCSQWTVPAEDHVLQVVSRERLQPNGAGGPFFVDVPDHHGTSRAHVAHTSHGVCVFRERDRCAIHAAGGEGALPVACRHYPRVVLRDARGILISLSHYCPTAASLLFDERRPHVTSADGRLRIAEPIEGLDARDVLPPLIHPGMLADVSGYGAWETAAIDTFAQSDDVAHALLVIGSATERLRTWTPSHGVLADAVRLAFEEARSASIPVGWDVRSGGRIVGSLTSHAPSHAHTAGRLPLELERVIANYVAARTFGNWISYQGRGLRTVVAWLHACHDVLRAYLGEAGTANADTLRSAIRSADLLMLHTIDSHAFARAASAIEDSRAA